MELIYAILIASITWIIVCFLDMRPHIRIIKYFNNETRLVKNIFTNKYYREDLDHYGWLTDDISMNIEITDLKQFDKINKKHMSKSVNQYKLKNKKIYKNNGYKFDIRASKSKRSYKL